jgi:hypothetical protein
MRRSNRHKVLFGSNHPFWPVSECLADFDKLALRTGNRGNAVRQSSYVAEVD